MLEKKSMMLKNSMMLSSVFAMLLSTYVFAHPDFDDEEQEGNQNHRQHHNKQERGHRVAHDFGKAFSQLDLSDQQKELLETLKENNKEEMKASFKQIKALKKQMRPLLEADSIDETAVKNLSLQIAELKSEQMIKMLMLKQQAVAFLTEEQKVKFEQQQEKRNSKRQEFRSKS